MENQTYFWVLVDLCLILTETGVGIRVISYNGRPTVTQGQHADLTCELMETNEELIQISWQKSTRGYRANHNFFLITPSQGPSHVKGRGDRVSFIGNTTALVGSIRLGDVSLTDEGIYTCIFTVFPSGPYKAEIHLNVQIPPVISVAVDTPPVVAEGQESILATCTAANAKPPADVRWSTASARQPLSLTTSTNTTLNPDDTATVRVHLKGEPSRVMHQQEVQCLVNHTTLSQQKVVPYEIDIHYPPNSVKIIIHEKPPQAPAFQCLVDANPPPSEFTWKRLNRSNLNETGGLLELVKVGPDFSGLYSCEVSNPYGAASGFLYVYKVDQRSIVPVALWVFLPFLLLFLCVGTVSLWLLFSRGPLRGRAMALFLCSGEATQNPGRVSRKELQDSPACESVEVEKQKGAV
ncbi:nectin-1 [Oncorhynchus kisutch]|uniref:nectin-1 n=1 Tax=Oncorhynchus kisutch TaxID=8019 RepID=UPI0009A060C9|nr:nectin-1 [Oncorhynchus kisutch]XP_020346205.1 nectin-1 [Oncorhynchus kisutch]